MSSVVEAKLTPAGSTLIGQLQQVIPTVFNAKRLTIRVRLKKESLPFPRPIQLGTIPDKRIRLIKPIPVELSRAEASVIASVAEFEEFGQGDTSSDALNDLGHSLGELFLSLQHDEARLGPDLRQLLDRLRTYIASAQST